MKRVSRYLVVAMLGLCLAATNVSASTVTYTMSIVGFESEDAMAHALLAPGQYTLQIFVEVTENALGGGNDGGLFISAFDLSTDNDGFDFVDVEGGFFGGPDGLWDSSEFSPFGAAGHVAGSVSSPTVSEETQFMSPTQFNGEFDTVGVGSPFLIGEGDFVVGGVHPAHLDLSAFSATSGAIKVAGVSGMQIVAVNPDTVNDASIWFIPEPGSLLLASMGLIGIFAGGRRRL